MRARSRLRRLEGKARAARPQADPAEVEVIAAEYLAPGFAPPPDPELDARLDGMDVDELTGLYFSL